MENLIQRILAEADYERNPYFTALTDGGFEKEDFVETQIQFFHAVTFFNRPMAVLAARIPTPGLRVEVLRNVWEEHGEGDLLRTHGATFLTFLSRLGGVTEEGLCERAVWPEVHIFNTTLVGACLFDDYLVGVGLLGIIERMFCDISGWIGRGVVARGWLETGEMIHYDLHVRLDARHSQDFFDILAAAWGECEKNRRAAEHGLLLGATLFNNLYEGLYRFRKRRIRVGDSFFRSLA